MEITELRTRREYKSFIRFIYRVYKGSPGFVDSVLYNLKDLLFSKSRVGSTFTLRVLVAFEDGKKQCQCVLFLPKVFKGVIYLGYFDAAAGSGAAVREMLKSAEIIAAESGAHKLIIGINGHLSLGVGFLQNEFDSKISFDSLYTPDYYPDFFSGGFYAERTFATYRSNALNAMPDISHKGYSARFFDFSRYDSEIAIFEKLTNECLIAEDDFYAPPDGFFADLFSSFKYILKNENIIFALNEAGEEIGYVFWHPDFNGFLKPGKRNGVLRLFFAARFCRFTTFKINALAIKPEYRHTRALIAMGKALKRAAEKGGFTNFETTFVWDSNTESVNTNLRNGFTRHREYKIYEKVLTQPEKGGG